MAPYIKTVKARYDGKNLILDEPLDLKPGEEIDVTISTEPLGITPPTDPRPLEERLEALRRVGGIDTGIVLPNEAFRRDENMYPDRW